MCLFRWRVSETTFADEPEEESAPQVAETRPPLGLIEAAWKVNEVFKTIDRGTASQETALVGLLNELNKLPARAAAPVATSAETRPPDTYELLTREIITIRHAIGKAIRAAAPVEPPKEQELQEYENWVHSKVKPEARINATEPVEQAPRPQEGLYRCECGQVVFAPQWQLDRFGLNLECCKCKEVGKFAPTTRAASSPAVRPQSSVAGSTTFEAARSLISATSEAAKPANVEYATEQHSSPAARVEQPTPKRETELLEALHEYDILLEQLDEALASPEEIERDTKAVGGYVSGLNLTYGANTVLKKAIERLKPAPVVAQRFTDELCEMLIKRDYIQNVPLTGPQIVMVVEQALQLDVSQRTEGAQRELDWNERYRTMPEVQCPCGLMTIPQAMDGVQWYWQRHVREGCTLELPNLKCWCGLLRSEHLKGHKEGVEYPKAASQRTEGEGQHGNDGKK